MSECYFYIFLIFSLFLLILVLHSLDQKFFHLEHYQVDKIYFFIVTMRKHRNNWFCCYYFIYIAAVFFFFFLLRIVFIESTMQFLRNASYMTKWRRDAKERPIRAWPNENWRLCVGNCRISILRTKFHVALRCVKVLSLARCSNQFSIARRY